MASTGSSSSALTEPLPPADYVVAVPAFNAARTIQPVIAAAAAVIGERFPGLRGRIVVADCGSTDDTARLARSTRAGADLQLVSMPGSASDAVGLPYHGVPGRARALRAVMEIVQESGARGVAVVDGTATTITTDWIARLIAPVVTDRFDYVSPVYRRHPFDGALVKAVVQPVYRACFGLRVRQPNGPDLACSRRMVEQLLQHRSWPGDVGDAGVDVWLSTAAAAGQFAVCEAIVGVRLRGTHGEPADLAATIAQLVGALFIEVNRRATDWQRVRGSKAVPLFDGVPPTLRDAPSIDTARLIEAFRLGSRELAEVWADVLPPAVILELRRLAAAPEDAFRFADRTWARIVYDFAVAHRHRVIAREHLLPALAPLYLAWVASLALECGGAPELESAVDERMERVCDSFEAEKPYLISRWRWPDRFRPR